MKKLSSQPRWLRSLAFAAVLGISGGGIIALAASRENTVERPMVNVKLDTAPLPRAEGGELSFAPVVKHVMPSVVKVVVRENGKEVANPNAGDGSQFDDPMFRWFFGPNAPGGRQQERRMYRQPAREGLGSGVVVSPDGYIITNNHVVDEKDLPSITFAPSDEIEVGDRVLAIGNPFGFGQTVTSGIVSGKSRSSRELGVDYQDFIQTDAAINPGNSGGALVDMRGRLIGINTAIYSRSGGFQGIGFAIPADLVRQVMNSLVQYGKVTRGFLGVMIQDVTPDLAEQFKLKEHKGAVISDVTPDSPAEKAGLLPNDVLVRFQGTPVENAGRLRLAVASTPPGTEVKMRVMRDGEEKEIKLTVGELPGDEKLASNDAAKKDDGVLNGVNVTDLTSQTRNEFEIPVRIAGAIVTEVEPDSAAAEAGLAPGDVILEINGKPGKSAADAVKLTEKAGDRKTLLRIWSRGGTHFLVVDETER